jgi:gluconate 5-dehydrogenase
MALCAAEHGAQVFVCGRRAEPLQQVAQLAHGTDIPGQIVPHVCDISDPDQVEQMLDLMEAEAGQIDGWVNNAYWGTQQCIPELTAAGLHDSLSGALTAPLLVSQSLAVRMKPHRSGSIVNVASMYGMVSPQPDAYRNHPEFHNPPAYGAGKAGLLQATRYLACHLAADGIRVNAISPGAFPSEAVQQKSEFARELEKRIPIGRLGKPEEIGGAIVFLLSDASSYMTGANLVIDGGWTAW